MTILRGKSIMSNRSSRPRTTGNVSITSLFYYQQSIVRFDKSFLHKYLLIVKSLTKCKPKKMIIRVMIIDLFTEMYCAANV